MSNESDCIRCRHPRYDHVIVDDEPGVIPPTYPERCLHEETTVNDVLDRTKIVNVTVTRVLCDCKMYTTVTDVANSLMRRVSKAKAEKYYNSYSVLRTVNLIEHLHVLEGHLERLRIDVNELLEAMDHEQFKDEPYNRVNLRCVATSWMVHSDGNTCWFVIVEKASPEASNLQGYLQDKLYDKWGSIIVNTEW